MIVILVFSESDIAKLASGFQLLIFMLINASVIVMRKSRIEAYDSKYHSPFYTWMQVFGIKNHRELKEYLLHNDRYITLSLDRDTPQAEFINRSLKEIKLPSDVLVALIQRNNQNLNTSNFFLHLFPKVNYVVIRSRPPHTADWYAQADDFSSD